MKNIFSNYYKIILSVVILIVLVALKEDYKTSFDEMSGGGTYAALYGMGIPDSDRNQTGQSKRCGICCFWRCLCGSAQSVNPHLELPDSVLCFCRRCSGTLFYVIYSDRKIRRLLKGTEGHPTSGLIDAFCEGYRIGDDLYIAGQEKLGAIDLNTKEFRYCREEKSWAEDITQGVKWRRCLWVKNGLWV